MTRFYLYAMYVLLLAGVAAELAVQALAGDHWRTFALAGVLAGVLIVRDDLTKAGAP